MQYNNFISSLTSKFSFLYGTFSWRPYKGKVTDENLLSIELANYLKKSTLENRCPYVWFHVANEGMTVTTKRVLMQGCLRRNMGKVPGVADFVFLGENKSFCLELKVKKRKLSTVQETFKEWCSLLKVGYAVAYTLEEAVSILEKEGILLPEMNRKKEEEYNN